MNLHVLILPLKGGILPLSLHSTFSDLAYTQNSVSNYKGDWDEEDMLSSNPNTMQLALPYYIKKIQLVLPY